MKRNEINDLKTKSKEELYTMLKKIKGEIANYQVVKYSQQSKKSFNLKGAKKDIARILTFIRRGEIEAL